MIRFGIVGFGLHAVKRLMPGFAAARRSRVTALTRRDLGQAQASARQFQIEHAFTSTADLCASPDVDAVFVASPDVLHLQDVLEAVRHRKPVLCEKPMARTPQEARAMVYAARNAGVMLGIAHVMRFEESVRLFRERILAGSIGQPQLARADFFAPMLTSARTWVHDPKLATGGPLADIGVHCIDTLRFVLGDEVRSVSARARYDVNSVFEAAATAALDFKSGMLATVAVSGAKCLSDLPRSQRRDRDAFSTERLERGTSGYGRAAEGFRSGREQGSLQCARLRGSGGRLCRRHRGRPRL